MIASRSIAAFAAAFTATLGFGLAFAAPALAGTSLVIDAASGAVLSNENANQPWHPASTTKMMTAYLALKAVRERRLGLETAIPASKRAASQPRVKVYIRAGQEITLDNALRIMMVKSANDIAYVIAEGVGGDVETFVGMMNTEAARLGMADTHFVNPNGWHHPDQQTSARDLALLAMALMREFPDYSDYWNTPSVQLGKQVLHNTNGLVGRYSGVGGMKTGFVCASGFNVVATATRGGRTLIAVVLGAVSAAERTVKAAEILDESFGKWGGSGYSVASMPAGGGRAASVCDDVRRKGGGTPLADDADSAGPVTGAAASPMVGGNGDGTFDRFPVAGVQPRATGAMLARTPSGRIVLGPRAETVPVPVAFGRTPGSASAPLAANVIANPNSQIAARTAPVISPAAPVAAGLVANGAIRPFSGPGGLFGTSSAFAPTQSGDVEPNASFSTGPMPLQGAIQAGAATAAPLSPSAAAGIKPAPRSAAKPQLLKPSRAAETKPAAVRGKPAQAAAKPAPKSKAKVKPGDA